MTEKELTALKERLRQLVVEDVGAAIRALKEALPDGSSMEDSVLSLEGRLNDTNRQRLRGLISNEELQRSYNQLRADLLDLITDLEPAGFKASGEGPAIPEGKTGSILYQIPGRMQLQQETKCIIRLAYEEESLIRNIELTEDTKVQSLRISQVMNVALVDPNPEETFRIRTFSGEEQFVERGDYTEWVFYVTPLVEGTFPLVLRVSVIELVLGKERKKDIVLEESIEITTAKTEGGTTAFKSAGYVLNQSVWAPVEESGIPESDFFPPPSPRIGTSRPGQQPVPPPVHKKQSTVRPSRRSYLRPVAAAASILLLATVALTILVPGLGSGDMESSQKNREPDLVPAEPGDTVPAEPAEPPEYDVRLLLAPEYREAEIWVDGRRTEPLEQEGEVLLLQLERKSGPYRFELRSAGNTVCQQKVEIDSDGQFIELNCPPPE